MFLSIGSCFRFRLRRKRQLMACKFHGSSRAFQQRPLGITAYPIRQERYQQGRKVKHPILAGRASRLVLGQGGRPLPQIHIRCPQSHDLPGPGTAFLHGDQEIAERVAFRVEVKNVATLLGGEDLLAPLRRWPLHVLDGIGRDASILEGPIQRAFEDGDGGSLRGCTPCPLTGCVEPFPDMRFGDVADP